VGGRFVGLVGGRCVFFLIKWRRRLILNDLALWKEVLIDKYGSRVSRRLAVDGEI